MKNIYGRTPISSLSLIIIFLLSCLWSHAQEKRTEISVAIGGPFSFLKYQTSGEVVLGNGFNAGLRYSYYLNQGLSIGLGVEYQSYKSAFKLSSLSDSYMVTDSENENFQFRYKAVNVREDQRLGFINIPVGIQFETPGITKLYLGAGAKVGFGVNGKFETKMQNLTTSGYYPQYNVELFSPSFAGFSSTENIKTGKQTIDLDIAYSAVFEAGVKQLIGNNDSIYVGFYLDYGLNNFVHKDENKKTVQYSSPLPVELQYNSLLTSSLTSNELLVSYGIKLRYAILR